MTISLLQIWQFSLASIIVFKQYIVGCYFPSGCFWEKILAIAPLEALVSSIKGYSGLKWVSRGANTSYFLSLLKAYIYIALKQNSWSFLVRWLRDQVILLQFLIKYQQKLQKPKNNYTPFTVYGGIYWLIIAVFFRLALIPSILIIKPRYFIRLILNSNFLILAQRLALWSRYRTLQTCSLCSNLFLE